MTGLIDRLEKKDLLKRQFIREDRRKVVIIPNVENSMKLLGPIFDELQQKTLSLIAAFSQKEIESIERYFREATLLMKETADHLNNP